MTSIEPRVATVPRSNSNGDAHGHDAEGNTFYEAKESKGGLFGLGLAPTIGIGVGIAGAALIGFMALRPSGPSMTAQQHAQEAIGHLQRARAEWPNMPLGSLTREGDYFLDRVPTGIFKREIRKGLGHAENAVARALQDNPAAEVTRTRTYRKPDKYTVGSVVGGLIGNTPMGRPQGTYEKAERFMSPELHAIEGGVNEIRMVMRGNRDERGMPDISHYISRLEDTLAKTDFDKLTPP